MKSSTTLIIMTASAVVAITGATLSVRSCDALNSQSQVTGIFTPAPTSFTAAVPCTVNGRPGRCATVNGVPVILTPNGYQPLTGAAGEQVLEETGREGLAQQPARPQEDQQVPVHENPEPAEHVNPVEAHPVIVDGK